MQVSHFLVCICSDEGSEPSGSSAVALGGVTKAGSRGANSLSQVVLDAGAIISGMDIRGLCYTVSVCYARARAHAVLAMMLEDIHILLLRVRQAGVGTGRRDA